jgi:hypothetical protein
MASEFEKYFKSGFCNMPGQAFKVNPLIDKQIIRCYDDRFNVVKAYGFCSIFNV